jgi:hypothetical protein
MAWLPSAGHGRVSKVPASRRVLLGVTAATLLAVQIATAQRPNRDFEAVGPPQLVTQILNAGVAQADDDAVTRAPSTVAHVPAPGAALPFFPRGSSQPGVAAGLSINAIFDSTITSDPNAAAIENSINTAIATIQSKFSDPITVTINFKKINSGLGQSSTFFATGPYSTFLAALKADATTSDDFTAIALLPSVSTNPVNGTSTINVKTANLRAVGINVPPPTGQPDGFISLNTTITSPGSPGTTGQYNLLPVVLHEIDEVLGLGSSLPTVLQGTIFPEDLFRYDQSSSRTFTITSTVQAFFSIDASTALAQFDNQNDGGDFGDWQSSPRPPGVLPKVQDAFATPGANPALSVELTALDVIGYDRIIGTAPSITLQPVNQRVVAGHNAQFTVVASATPSPTYQWQLSTNGGSVWSNLSNSSLYSGVTTTTLTITGASLGLNGDQYRAIAANAFGTATSNAATLMVRRTTTPGDFDGDGKADPTVFRPSTGISYVLQSSTGTGAFYQWGISGDIPVAGDYDGDGKTDVAVFRPSTGIWYVLQSSTGTGAFYQWGLNGDIPAPGDYDGDGKTDVAVFRPSTGIWYVLQSSTGTGAFYQWGLNGDIPVARDYDGDGKTDVAVFRPSTGIWYVLQSSTGTGAFYQWGLSGDIPAPGDYDGDGKTDVAVFRPSTGIWYVLQSSTGTGAFYQWGLNGDLPVPGDFDGDGKTDVAVFRPSTGIWYVLQSSTGTGAFYQWGLNGDIPIMKP